MDGGADVLTIDDAANIAWHLEVEEDHRQVIIPGHGDGSCVGDLKITRQKLIVGQLVKIVGVRVLLGITVVDAVNPLLTHEERIGSDL